MSTAVAPRASGRELRETRDPAAPAKAALREAITRAAPTLAAMLPRSITPDRVFALTLLAANKEPKLLQCTPESVVQGLFRIAQWGLELGTTAHLLCFNTNKRFQDAGGRWQDNWQMACEAVKGYQGIIQLARQSGLVRDLYAEPVYARDHFKVTRGDSPRIEHYPDVFAEDRGALRGFYAVALGYRGELWIATMSVAEVNAIRDRKKKKPTDAVSGPWLSDYVEMGRKTVVRRLGKGLPQTAAVQSAFDDGDEDDDAPAAPAFSAAALGATAGAPALAAGSPSGQRALPAPGSLAGDGAFDMQAALGVEKPRALAAPSDYYGDDPTGGEPAGRQDVKYGDVGAGDDAPAGELVAAEVPVPLAAPAPAAPLTLETALACVLPGGPTTFNGQGGKALGTLSPRLLKSVRKWAGQKQEEEPDDRLARLLEAIALVLPVKEQEAEQAAGFDESAKPAAPARPVASAPTGDVTAPDPTTATGADYAARVGAKQAAQKAAQADDDLPF